MYSSGLVFHQYCSTPFTLHCVISPPLSTYTSVTSFRLFPHSFVSHNLVTTQCGYDSDISFDISQSHLSLVSILPSQSLVASTEIILCGSHNELWRPECWFLTQYSSGHSSALQPPTPFLLVFIGILAFGPLVDFPKWHY